MYVAVAMIGPLRGPRPKHADYGVMWSSRRQAQNTPPTRRRTRRVSLALDSPTDFERAPGAPVAETVRRTRCFRRGTLNINQ